MGLKDSQESLWRRWQGAPSAAHHQLGHLQGGLHFTGVMGVVINDVTAIPGAAMVETTARGFQALQTVDQRFEGHTLHPAGCDRGCCIAEVVQAGHREREATGALTVFEEVSDAAIAIKLMGQGGKGGPFCVMHRPPGVRLKVFAQNRTVAVGQDPVAPAGKALHGADQISQVAVVIGVIEFQVRDHTQAGVELDQ